MKKCFFLCVCCMFLWSHADCQIAKTWSWFSVYLGLHGGYYKTEVKIPIQQIRYQNSKDTGRHNVIIIDYTKSIDGIKYAEPYIAAGTNYSLFTDPQTSAIYISVRPTVMFMTYNDAHAKIPFRVPATGYPFPMNFSYVATTALTSASTLSLLKNQLEGTIDKTEESATAYTVTTTRTKAKFDTVLTRRAADIKVTDYKATTVTAPVVTHPHGVDIIPDIDPNAPELRVAYSPGDDAYIIPSDSYLFVPDGNKMPNFSQLLENQWFVSGPFSLLVKWRPRIPAKDNLPALDGVAASTGLSFGMVTGAKHSLSNLRNGNSYKKPITYQFPLFMMGFNSTDVTRRLDSDNDGRFDAYTDKETRIVFSGATGIGLQIQTVNIMGLVGTDYLLGAGKAEWPYHRKLWYGLSFGVSLDKLVGLSK